MAAQVDLDRAAGAVRELLDALGVDCGSEELAATPRRVAETYAEFLRGVRTDPATALSETVAEAGAVGDVVLLRDIEFRSVCAHHLLPFQGVAHIAYLPSERIVGLSALPKVVAAFAARPQMQERLGEEIAETLNAGLQPRGVLVVLEARHGCLADRNLSQSGTGVANIAARGAFCEPARRQETMSLLRPTPRGSDGSCTAARAEAATQADVATQAEATTQAGAASLAEMVAAASHRESEVHQ